METKSVTNGHSSITIEQGGVEVQSWGYYPEGLKTNYFSDGEFDQFEVDFYLKASSNGADPANLKFHQAKYCHLISEVDVVRAKAFAESYESKFGKWSEHSNNCVQFAKYIYSEITEDRFILPIQQPMLLHGYLQKKVQEQSTADFGTQYAREPADMSSTPTE